MGGTTSVTINPATLTYTANAASMKYGNSVPALSGSVSGFVGGETQATATTGTSAFSTLAGATSHVGNYGVTGAGLSANNGNYTFSQAAGNSTDLSITARAISLSGTRTYDATANVAAAQLVAGNIVNSDVVNLGGTATVSSKNVATYNSFATNSLTSSNSDYTVIGGTTSVTINPATLTYTANAATMTYGNSVPALSGRVSGFVGGETQGTATTGTSAFSTLASATSHVGSYGVTGAGLSANNGNYTFSQAAGNSTDLSITARAINLSGARTYDATANVAAAQLVAGNIVNSDVVNLGGTATIASKNVATYNSFATNSLTSSNSDYTVIGGTTSVTINPAT